MDLKSGISPGDHAAERLNNAQNNLNKLVESGQLQMTVTDVIALAGVQAQMAHASATLDLASAIREGYRASGPRDA